MNMIISISEPDATALVDDYSQRMVTAEQYADECVSILVQQHGADPAKVDRTVFTSHHFSRSIDGKAPRHALEQVAVALDTWRPCVLGM